MRITSKIILAILMGLTGGYGLTRLTPSPQQGAAASFTVAESEGPLLTSHRLPGHDAKGNPIAPLDELSLILKEKRTRENQRALYLLLPRLSKEELITATQRLMNDPTLDWRMYIFRLGAMDMPAAIALVENRGRRPMRFFVQEGNLFQQWTYQDEAAARAWYDALPQGRRKRDLEPFWIAGLAEKDPERALGLLMEVRQQQTYQLHPVLSTLMAVAPEQTVTRLNTLPDNQRKGTLLKMAFQQWIGRDPNAAEAAIRALPEGPTRTDAITALAAVRIHTDSKAALRLIEELMPEGKAKETALLNLYRQWVQTDLESAQAHMATLPEGNIREQINRQIQSHTASQDPELAAKEALTITDTAQRTQSLSEALRYWTQSDPDAALEWIGSQPDLLSQSAVIRPVSQNLMYQDAEAALKLIQRMPDEKKRAEILRDVSYQWVHQDREAAEAYLATMKPGEERDLFLNRFLAGLSFNDPEAASRRLQEYPEGKEKTSLVGTIGLNWSRQNPQTAISWVLSQTTGTEGDSAVSRIVAQWAQADYQGASEWLESVPPSPTRDTVIQQFTQQLVTSDPMEAAYWAYTIENEGQRTNALRRILSNWGRVDAEGARAWLDEVDLPENLQEQFLKMTQP